MSFPSTAARLEFFDMPENAPAPAVNPTRARVDAVCSSSTTSSAGQVHGTVDLGRGGQIRVMTYPPDRDHPARISIRRWAKDRDGRWSPVHRQDGVVVYAFHAAEFARAVADACKALEGEAHR